MHSQRVKLSRTCFWTSSRTETTCQVCMVLLNTFEEFTRVTSCFAVLPEFLLATVRQRHLVQRKETSCKTILCSTTDAASAESTFSRLETDDSSVKSRLSDMATVMEEIICLLKNANFEEPSEVGVCLLTKSEACREQYTLPRRTRSRTVIGPMEEFFIFHIGTDREWHRIFLHSKPKACSPCVSVRTSPDAHEDDDQGAVRGMLTSRSKIGRTEDVL